MAEVPQKSLERYDGLDRIAVGGMAEVFLAKAYGAHGFEKTIAIKRILPELAKDPEFAARVRTRVPLVLGAAATPVKQSFSAQVQQVVSVAGDAARKDINQTKFEFEIGGEWPQARFLKFTAKPVIDWVQDARTGAVGELEGGWRVGRDWELALLGGALLWGKGVPSTYGKRAEFKASYRF